MAKKDKDTLKCPHGKHIEMVDNYGLISYNHIGGGLCSILNSFKTTTDDIASEMAEHMGDAKAFRALFTNSTKVRREFYEDLSKCKNANDLELNFRMVDGLLSAEVMDEIYDTFGMVAIKNIRILGIENMEMYRNYDAIGVKTPKKHLPMIDLVQTSMFGKIKEDLTDREKKLKNVLKGFDTKRKYSKDNADEFLKKLHADSLRIAAQGANTHISNMNQMQHDAFRLSKQLGILSKEILQRANDTAAITGISVREAMNQMEQIMKLNQNSLMMKNYMEKL